LGAIPSANERTLFRINSSPISSFGVLRQKVLSGPNVKLNQTFPANITPIKHLPHWVPVQAHFDLLAPFVHEFSLGQLQLLPHPPAPLVGVGAPVEGTGEGLLVGTFVGAAVVGDGVTGAGVVGAGVVGAGVVGEGVVGAGVVGAEVVGEGVVGAGVVGAEVVGEKVVGEGVVGAGVVGEGVVGAVVVGEGVVGAGVVGAAEGVRSIPVIRGSWSEQRYMELGLARPAGFCTKQELALDVRLYARYV
jgi:hypothetical protein